jgi:carbonic anhydrase
MAEMTSMLEANERFAEGFDAAGLPMPPKRPIAVLTCIDARLHPEEFLGFEIGDAHVVRNASGRATDDAVRSLVISSWLLGTREFVVIHHTGCGMMAFTDDVLQGMIEDATGEDVSGMRFETFSDLDESVAGDVGRLRSLAILPEGVTVAGYVYDVDSGRLREVVPVGSG